MPVAETLRNYLADPSATLPKRKNAKRAIQEILPILEQSERGGGATYSLHFGDQMGVPFYAVGLDNNLTKTVAPSALEEALSWFLRA